MLRKILKQCIKGLKYNHKANTFQKIQTMDEAKITTVEILKQCQN